MSFRNGEVIFNTLFQYKSQIDKYFFSGSLTDNISGIELDLEEASDFIEAYKYGVVVNSSILVNYFNSSNTDCIDSEILDNEFLSCLDVTFNKIESGAEVVPKGLFIIKDNRKYYFTLECYLNFFYKHADFSTREKMLSLSKFIEFNQLKNGLINVKKVPFTIDYVTSQLQNMSEKDNFEWINPSDYLYNLIGSNYKSLSLKRDRRKKS